MSLLTADAARATRRRAWCTLAVAVLAIALGLMLATRSSAIVCIAMLSALIVARTWRMRLCCGLVGGGMLVGMPWIILPAVAGWAWFLMSNTHRPTFRLQRFSGHRPQVGLLAAIGFGLLSGFVASFLVADQLRDQPLLLNFARPSVVLLVLSVVAMAALNASGEELIWRAALSDAGSTLAFTHLVVLQAVSFGLAHYHGLPGGVTGMLACAVFSVGCSFLHVKAGLTASITAHFVADIIIFASALPRIAFAGWWAPN